MRCKPEKSESIKREWTNEQLVIKIQAGIDVADNVLLLWQQNRGMICKIANRYRHYESVEDLEQEGYIGLCKAVEHFEHCAGATFISYATYWIKQTILRYLQDNGHIVRIPVHTHTAIQKYRRFCAMFEQEYNRKPDDQEIGCYMKLSRQQVKQLRKDTAMFRIGSLDETLNVEDASLTVGDTVASKGDLEADVIEDMAAGQLKETLWGVVDSLDKDCAAVIRYRFQDNLTLKETGQVMATTPEAVRQCQAKGMRKLRSNRDIRQIGQEYGYIQSHAYRGNGVGTFNRTWTSSTEFTALGLMEEWG